jgi:hypothetical protein
MTLAVDPRPEVRLSVSRFKELTFRRLKHLARDADPEVAAGAIRAIKQKRKGKPFVRRYIFRRGIVLPLLLVGLWLPPVLSSHTDSSQPQLPTSQVAAYWQPGQPFASYWNVFGNGLSNPLPAGGSVFADPVDTQGTSTVTVTTGSAPLAFEVAGPGFTPFDGPIVRRFQLGMFSSATIVVTPGGSPVNLLITSRVGETLTNADVRIIYEGLPQ